MKRFNKFVYDNLDREYKRKNLYLYEVADLQEKIKNANESEKVELKNKLKELQKNKKEHQYNKTLAEFKNSEKLFLKELDEKSKSYKVTNGTNNKKVNGLEIRLFKAKEKLGFYEKYTDLTYDAELIYEQSKVEIIQIPPVIEFAKDSKKELDKAQKALSELSEDDNKKFQEEFNKFKEEENRILKEDIKIVKSRHSEGLISEKAEGEAIKRLKRSKIF